MTPIVGTSLQNGKYVLTQLLEQRGVSLIFQASQLGQQPAVVIQTLNQAVIPATTLASTQEKFFSQVQKVASLDHANLVNVLDWFGEGGLPFLVMRQATGQTLADWIQLAGALPESTALTIVRQIGSVLSQLHQQGVIHGSLTPQRIRRTDGTEQVELTDFGLSHPALLEVPARVSTTTAYAAIETTQPHAQLTPATDLYALAAIFYYLVTGQIPIPSAHRAEKELLSPRLWATNLSATSEIAILAGMQLAAEDRPLTIAAWLEQLGLAELPMAGFPSASLQLPLVAHPGLLANQADPSPMPTSPLVSHSAPLTTAPIAEPSPANLSPMQRSIHRKTRLLNPKFFRRAAIISAIAGSIGICSGLIFRIAGTTTGPGATLFHMDQSFPSQKSWPITASPVSEPISPVTKEVPVQEQWQPEPTIPPTRQATTDARPSAEPAPVDTPAPHAPEAAKSPTVSPSPHGVDQATDGTAGVPPQPPKEVPTNVPPLPAPAAPAPAEVPEPIAPPAISEPAPPAATTGQPPAASKP